MVLRQTMVDELYYNAMKVRVYLHGFERLRFRKISATVATLSITVMYTY